LFNLSSRFARYGASIDVLSDEEAHGDQKTLELNLRSPERQLMELKMEHADLNALVDMAVHAFPVDELLLRRLKKRRLQLRDQIAQLEISLDPPEPA
jgi:hypothetical protein